VAETVGYPVMIKAAAGGGGKGIRIAENEAELRKLAPQAQAEAAAAFGDGGLYMERAVQSPRHIEVQIVGDGTNAVHFFERECSLQRRRQKVWEEAGAICLDDATRTELCEGAVALAKAVNYCGAGTLEYLYDEARNAFYFIEMNTRIQVEHPVTEEVTGVDLVKQQLRVAAGEKLKLKQSDIKMSGHAIECRINAEDPYTFRPSPGRITVYHPPGGPGVRMDSHIYDGYVVPPYYDSLIGKLICHAEDRDAALTRMQNALTELVIDGIDTNIPLHIDLVSDAAFRSGGTDIHYLERRLGHS
jgi:acetyl-CoA carboxylase biotin carboxylase subunit